MEKCKIKNMNWFDKLLAVIIFNRKTYSNKQVEDLEMVCKMKETEIEKLTTVIKDNEKVIENQKIIYNQYKNEKNKEIRNLKSEKEQEINKLKIEKNKKIKELKNALSKKIDELNILQKELNDLNSKYEELKDILEENEEKEKHLTCARRLTCEEIRGARDRYLSGEKLKDLAKEIGVSTPVLSKAIRGITYKNCK